MKPITKVLLRSAMLKDQKGKIKDQGWLYKPKSGTLLVPDENGDHARPLLICEDANGDTVVTIVVHQEGLVFRFADGKTTEKAFEEISDEFLGF